MKYSPNIVAAFFRSHGIPEPIFEHPFAEEVGRKFRFDMAWPYGRPSVNPLYLEVDGGIWIKGGHNRGAQMKKDWEKRNLASEMGWRGLWVEPKDLMTKNTAEMIKRCLCI